MRIPCVICSLAIVNVLVTIHAARPQTGSPVGAGIPVADRPQQPSQPAERFDERVRSDFFAGFRGNTAALARAMEVCEKTLAADPKHAEAMVWHGSGLLFWAGQAFARGDASKGIDLWERGMKEMDAAVALVPDTAGVLIPRGATLLEASRNVPGQERTALLAKALADYEKVHVLQQPFFAKLSAHARGELLFGLAEGWARAGDAAKARRYFEQILRDAEGSGQEPRARAWLETGQPPAQTGCIGCH